jgi:RNase P subunit RPR2
MVAAQGGICAGCLRPLEPGRKTNVDHCHSTGRVRGILCPNCNTTLGLAYDNPETLERLAAYLRNA